jgi:hypothetical protein
MIIFDVLDEFQFTGTGNFSTGLHRYLGPAPPVGAIPIYTWPLPAFDIKFFSWAFFHENLKELNGVVNVYLIEPTAQEIADMAVANEIVQLALKAGSSAVIGKNNLQVRKLGRKPSASAPKLKLASYLLPGALPAPLGPQGLDWSHGMPVPYPMDLNDVEGDCVIAGMSHIEQTWTYAAQGEAFVATDTQVQSAYEAIGGYVPGNTNTDNGCDMLTAAQYWQSPGVFGRPPIAGFVQVNPLDQNEVKIATQLFGPLFVGLNMPAAWQQMVVWQEPTDLNSADAQPGSWGGHCVMLHKWSGLGLEFLTWGYKQPASWGGFSTYCDELFACVSPDFISKAGLNPTGVNMSQLLADLKALSST